MNPAHFHLSGDDESDIFVNDVVKGTSMKSNIFEFEFRMM